MRNLTISYLLAIFTGGLYGFFWLFKMARQSEIPNYKFKANAFIVTFILYVASIILYGHFLSEAFSNGHYEEYLINRISPAWFLVYVVTLFYLIFNTLSGISNYINANGERSPKGIKLYFLFILYLVALPVLQKKLNNIKSKNT